MRPGPPPIGVSRGVGVEGTLVDVGTAVVGREVKVGPRVGGEVGVRPTGAVAVAGAEAMRVGTGRSRRPSGNCQSRTRVVEARNLPSGLRAMSLRSDPGGVISWTIFQSVVRQT